MTGVKPSMSEIQDAIDWAEQGNHFPGMTYEEGVLAALFWVTGESSERPDSED